MRHLAAIVILAAICPSPLAAQVVNPDNEHVYFLTSSATDVFTARAEAASYGGYLVAISDAAENAFVAANFSNGTEQPWIGLSDEIQEGVFLWDSGEPFNHQNWAPGEPDDFMGIQDHVQFLQTIHQWSDIMGTQLLHGIIEVPPLQVPSVYPTIQSAINAAPVGATIVVAPGTYVENIDFIGKDITVRSSGGYEVTTIDGAFNDSVVKFVMGETSAATLEGFTIEKGVAPNGTPGGGGIIASGSPTIRDCRIRFNSAPGLPGGGIACVAGSCTTIDSCLIEHNTANNWAGVYLDGGGTVLMASCTVRYNMNTQDPAVPFGKAVGNDANLVVEDTLVAFNSGAGIGISGPYFVTASRCVFRGNGDVGAAVGFGVIENCLAVENGGAGFSADAQGLVQNCTSVNNDWGIFIGSGSAVFKNLVIWNNNFSVWPPNPNTTAVSYSCIEAWPESTTIISQDPLFVDPAGGDYHLSPISPCVDAGDSSMVGVLDIDGTPRVAGANVDMGADEVLGASEPGSREGFNLFTWANGIGDPVRPNREVYPGDLLRTLMVSPDGSFVGAQYLVLGQVWSGAPPLPHPVFPEIRITLEQVFLITASLSSGGFPAPGLPPDGLNSYYLIPPGLSGVNLRVQGFAITPFAANGSFSTTDGRDIVFL